MAAASLWWFLFMHMWKVIHTDRSIRCESQFPVFCTQATPRPV